MIEERKLEIIVSQYARSYGKARPKYFTKNKKGETGCFSQTGTKQKEVPQKYMTPRFIWKPNLKTSTPTLFDTLDNEFVVANPNLAGKAHPIKGQENNTGQVHQGKRAQVFKAIKESCIAAFQQQAKSIPVDWYPLRIDIALYDIVGNPFTLTKDATKDKWDVDNLCAVYKKTVLDLLVNQGWVKEKNAKYKVLKTLYPEIPRTLHDDDRFYVSLPLCYWRPLPTEEHEKRYLKITIKPDLECHNHPIFKQFHGRAILPQGTLF